MLYIKDTIILPRHCGGLCVKILSLFSLHIIYTICTLYHCVIFHFTCGLSPVNRLSDTDPACMDNALTLSLKNN
jgi:hypothetical protein